MCGIVGIYSNKDIAKELYYSLYSIQHRGQESCGMAISNGDNINYKKDMGLVGDVFKENELANLKGNIGIGHVRYSTAGGSHLANCQPLVGRCRKRELALAHNGNLVNANYLRDMLEEDGYMFLLGKNDFWRQPYLYKGKQLVLESPWEITVNGI